ncbi:hypothetical protein RKE38_17340 [Phycicoccus sp. M110.8]|uniref:hypothetical protein n=1 Tax=Phycicoccus sp. M110.8 TaxID=3075433 RepID=UPI0028FD36ED|nr:hypothetical protein [Phycicoccus sp. M110.8]MDU0315466.1 hypothetical protein [Phycicoccus sp. M110.8]
MTQHRDHRSIVHPPRATAPPTLGAVPPLPAPRLLVQGAGDGLSLRHAEPR